MTIDEYAANYGRHHAQGVKIAAGLRASGDMSKISRAARMEACGTLVQGYECPDCGEYHVIRTNLCRDRLCPNCAAVLSARRARAALAALAACDRVLPLRVSHMVLTMQHTRSSDLGKMLRVMTRGYGRLMRTSSVSGCALGAYRSLEVTFGDENGYHPHIHAVVAEDKATGCGLTVPVIRRAWRDAIGADYDPQVWYEQAYEGSAQTAEMDGEQVTASWEAAVREAVKYAIKPDWLSRLPPAKLEYAADALRGARLMTSSGALKRALQERATPAIGERECVSCYTHAAGTPVWLRFDHNNQRFEAHIGTVDLTRY